MSFPRYPKYKDSGVEWLGPVPEHWNRRRFKQIFREREDRSTAGEETLLSVSAYTGVSPRSEVIDEGEHLSRADSLEGYKVCYQDDLVMNIMLAWNRGLAFTQQNGIVSPAYSVFKVIDGSAPWFLNYLVRSNEYTGYFKAFSAGVIDSRLRLYPDVFGSLSCCLPPSHEQTRIAEFLDRETKKIDELVAEQRRLMELLKEKRQAVISHAVTKGLNPHAPMKPSGIEWLGDIPAHWSVTPLKWLSDENRPIMYGIVLPGPDIDQGIPILKGGNVKPSRMNLESMARTTPDIEAPYARARLRAGDLVYSIRGSIGDCEPVPPELERSNITQDVARIAIRAGVCPTWARWALLSSPVREELASGSLGAAVRGVNIFDLKRANIPTPPPHEQQMVAAHLDAETDKLDRLTAEAQRAIDLLQERRTALISAAVTGQIDVRDLPPKKAA
jgi:type I restriction enzyme, S subunit